ncbi:MAG: hypothetical protein RJA36_2760 [Pseudomonadota bacterium]|jgi:DNA-binding transcriptional LysR family regulator
MDRLQNIETFVRVAETKSFSETARQLRVARSVVTTRIQQLEDYVGAPLFHRSTRVVGLTEVGRAYLRECSELVARANDLVDQMRDARSSPQGLLRVHAATGLVLGHLAPMLKAFQTEYPDIRLDLNVSDEIVDPVKTGVDCALQIFPTTSTELVSRPLFPVRRVFCATPQYLEQHGRPKTPRDLHNHKIGFYSRYPSRDRWTFHHKEESISLYLNPALLTNSIHLLQEYALEHAGIVCLPTWVASEALLTGKLEVVLPEHLLTSFWLSAVYAPTSRNALKLRVFIDYITARFKRLPCWDERLIERGLILETLVSD